MIICSRCNTECEEGAKFCQACGNDLTINVAAATTDELKNLAEALNNQAVHTEKQSVSLNKLISEIPKKIGDAIKNIGRKINELMNKIGKKKLIISAIVLSVIIACTILIVKFIVPFAPHYFKGNSALEAKDYVTAIAEYEMAEEFFNSKSKLNETRYLYAGTLLTEEKYKEASEQYMLLENYEDSADKLYQSGLKLLEKEEYKYAINIFEHLATDEVKPLKAYAVGMTKFNDKDYTAAKNSFQEAENYKDSDKMIQICDFLEAEEYCKDGEFSKAQEIYNRLPKDFSYNEISVAEKLDVLDKSKTLIGLAGTWRATKNYIETRNVYKRNGSWDSWYHDEVIGGQTLEITCTMNSDNTFDIKGKVSFYKFDDYSSLSAYCRAKLTTKNFTIYNVTKMPSSYEINQYTKLNYSNGVFSIKYSEKDNYSSYFYNLYSSSVTYGTKS